MDIKDYEIEHREAIVEDFIEAYREEWNACRDDAWDCRDIDDFATTHPDYWAFVTERYSTRGE